MLILVAGLSGASLVVLGEDQRTSLAGASLLASGGDVRLSSIRTGRAEGDSLDDLHLDQASRLTAVDDGSFLVLFDSVIDPGLVRATVTGEIDAVGFMTAGSFGRDAVAVAPDGGMAVAANTEILLRGFNWTDEGNPDARFEMGAIAREDDGSVLVSSLDDSRIDLVAADGSIRGLLGPVGSDAQVVVDQPLGPIVSLLRLPDGRVVFVADSADDYQMQVLDDREVRPLEAHLDGQEVNPVATSGDRPPADWERRDRLAMTPLGLAPDGRVLTTGLGRRGDPQISLVDVDTGEVEVLATLEDVEPTIEEPVSATIVGRDLIFLAEAKLWKLEGAVGS